MDALTQLEARVEQLLTRLGALEARNACLADELARARQDNNELADENKSLRNSLCQCEAIRREASERIAALLVKIGERGHAG